MTISNNKNLGFFTQIKRNLFVSFNKKYGWSLEWMYSPRAFLSVNSKFADYLKRKTPSP